MLMWLLWSPISKPIDMGLVRPREDGAADAMSGNDDGGWSRRELNRHVKPDDPALKARLSRQTGRMLMAAALLCYSSLPLVFTAVVVFGR